MLLVGGILFEIATGVLNIQYDYVFGFDFYTAHYYGAWVFIAAFVVHVAHQAAPAGQRAAVPVAARRAAHLPRRHPAGAARPGRPGRHATPARPR